MKISTSILDTTKLNEFLKKLTLHTYEGKTTQRGIKTITHTTFKLSERIYHFSPATHKQLSFQNDRRPLNRHGMLSSVS